MLIFTENKKKAQKQKANRKIYLLMLSIFVICCVDTTYLNRNNISDLGTYVFVLLGNLCTFRLMNLRLFLAFFEICAHMTSSDGMFPSSMPDDTIKRHIECVTNVMWYLDGKKDKMQDRAKHSENVALLPERLTQFLIF